MEICSGNRHFCAFSGSRRVYTVNRECIMLGRGYSPLPRRENGRRQERQWRMGERLILCAPKSGPGHSFEYRGER
ncbi:hypothetical protein C9411_24810 [Serratia sp. Nf2]|nr:hypothetical protein C9411_24810 [Serratia sp. Nf2]